MTIWSAELLEPDFSARETPPCMCRLDETIEIISRGACRFAGYRNEEIAFTLLCDIVEVGQICSNAVSVLLGALLPDLMRQLGVRHVVIWLASYDREFELTVWCQGAGSIPRSGQTLINMTASQLGGRAQVRNTSFGAGFGIVASRT